MNFIPFAWLVWALEGSNYCRLLKKQFEDENQCFRVLGCQPFLTVEETKIFIVFELKLFVKR